MTQTNKATATALGPMVVAVAEQFLPAEMRIVDDQQAAAMLSGAGKVFAGLCRYPALRRMLMALSEAKGPGVWGGILARKRFIDDVVAETLTDGMGAGMSALVILGAGFDTRGIRFALPRGLAAFEVDLPENIAAKRATIDKAFGGVPERLHLVSVDFETDDLAQALAEQGHDASTPTLFVWEGVTQYLTEPAVRKILDFLAGAAPGSKLVFTYVLKDFIAGTDMHNATPIDRNLVEKAGIWHFGLMPEAVGELLAPYGWIVEKDVGADDHRSAYFAPVDRDLLIMDIERCVSATKRA